MNSEVIYFPKQKILEAVKKFGSPFFIYEEKKLRENCRVFVKSFKKYFSDFVPLYAFKANPNPDLVKIIKDEGFGGDFSSEAEAWLGEKLKMSGMYTGNYSSQEDLKFVLSKKNIILNLDDISMLNTVVKIGLPKVLSFRVNPGFGKSQNESNVFAGPDAKYGVPFEKASQAYSKAKKAGVKHFGIHMMTGSNVPITEKNYFAEIVEKLFEIIAQIKKDTGIEMEFMNMGGGFGVPYKPEENSLNMKEIAHSVRKVFDKQCKKYNLKEPKLYTEPGRFITCNAGFLVGKVTVIKDGYKKFVGLDTSTNDMPRPLIYNAYHHISVVAGEKRKQEKVSVVGRICENNDQFAKDRLLPVCKVGDVLVIHNSGAHARVMAYNYNGRPRVAEYLITKKGVIKQIRKAETIKDLYKGTNL